MKSRFTLFFIVALAYFFQAAVFAQTTYYVSLTGSNTAPYSNWVDAATSIQIAVDAASDGDTVLVDDGTYVLTTNVSITKGITVRSRNGYPASIVDGNDATRCFYIDNTNAVLDGFTIQNGYNPSGYGGGVDINNAGIVQNSFLTGNQARDGGAIALDNGGYAINCIITNNLASDNGSGGYGGGVRCLNGGTVRGCLVYGNTSVYYGGGINIWNAGAVQNCTIVDNTCSNGAGIRARGSSTIVNSIIYFNNGDNWVTDGSSYSFNYSCSTPALPGSGTGNITDDPLFENASSNDYHLTSSSTLINAGLNDAWMTGTFDLAGNDRIYGGTVDIGAFEYTVTNFLINASVVGSGGTISPLGDVTVSPNTDQTFTITPDLGYHVNDVLVDGSSVGAVTSYTFLNVTANHTISASFAINTYTLTITSVNGTVTKNPDQANYSYGTTVELTATPSGGYTFTGWSGDATGSTNPLTITMDGNKNITANFSINTYTLTVTSTNGTVTKNPDQATYNNGTVVTLTPVADVGYHFLGWSGDASGNTNPLSVTMDANKNITANFLPSDVIAFDDFNRPDESPFTVGGNWVKAFGSGYVNLSNNQVAGVSGEALYYWQGAGTFDNTRQFARARVVNANGQVGLMLLGGNNQALNVAWNSGTLYIYWYLNGIHQGELAHVSSTIHDGDIIEAVLDGGIIYAKINGTVVQSVQNTTSLTSGNPGFEFYQGGAVFDDWEAGTPPVSSYTITASAGAGGAISPNGSVNVDSGNNQTFTISANAGYHIADVLVDGTSVGAVSSYTFNNVTANHTIAASFVINTYTLTITSVNGTVTKNPDQASYSYGSTVELTATPSTGYTFTGWSGDATGSDNPLTVTMNSNKNITATFTINPSFVEVTSPNGGETWSGGSTQNITWTSSNVTDVNIEFSSDNGSNWSTVASAVSAASGTFPFTVPSINSTNCLIRISDTGNASINDVSDATFTINTTATNPTITIGSATTVGGSYVTIPVDLTATSGFQIGYLLQGKIHFDASKLQFLYGSYNSGTLVNDFGWAGTFYSISSSTADFILAGSSPINTSGTLFYLTFQVIDGSAGSANVTSSAAEWLVDISSTPLTIVNGTITYSSSSGTSTNQGDATLNYIVDINDAVAVIYHWLGLYPLSGQAFTNADVDFDGDVDIDDYLKIIFFIYLHDWNFVFPTISPSSTVVINGAAMDNNNMITVPVELANSQNVQSVEVQFNYDPSELEFVNVNSNSAGNVNIQTAAKNGKLSFVAASSQEIQNGKVATLHFKKLNANSVSELNASYKLNDNQLSGNNSLSISNGMVTDVGNTDGSIPQAFALAQNYPNPFNPTTQIKFSIPETAHVILTVYNSLGQRIAELVNEEKAPGIYEVPFDGNNLSNGIYFYRISAGNYSATKKMILLK